MGRPKKNNYEEVIDTDIDNISDNIDEISNNEEVVMEKKIEKKRIFCKRCGVEISIDDKKCPECLAPTEWLA